MDYQFKRPPRMKQLEAFEKCKDARHFALFARMRTGKSKIALDKGCYLFSKGKINSIVIIVRNGVHVKWILDDVPADVPDHISHRTAIWRSGNKNSMEECENLFDPGQYLRILAMNIEAFQRKDSPAEQFLKRFLNATDALMVIDESHDIANPDAARTKILSKLGDRAAYKMVLTGTPGEIVHQYSQYGFLDYDILNQSFTSFKHTYAEVLPPDHPTMQAILARGARFAPTVIAKDREGRPIYKNVDKFRELVRDYTFTCTLEECADIPETVYETMYYELDPKQRKIYDELVKKARVEFEEESVTVMHKLTLLMRLQQVLSGYLPADDDRGMIHLFKKPEDNPRIKALLSIMESMQEEQVLIWCRFVPEIEMLAGVFGDDCVTYYGATKDREAAKNDFLSGRKRIFIGNTATAGVGLNFSGTYVSIYYSNTESYFQRDQAEARQQFVDQKRHILVIDIEAENTIDHKIIRSLRAKKDVASIFFEK